MIKLLSTLTYSVFGIALASAVEQGNSLSEGQWVVFGTWATVITFTATIGIIIFKSVWLRDGYAGINKILEDHEVGKFITHVLSFLCLLSLQTMVATQPLIDYRYNEFLYFLFASGILGSGVFSIAEKFGVASKIGDLLYKKPEEPTENGRSNSQIN
jgi:uncharacterized membrane protein YhaH (DUF805 family)